jgi:hypothetical protein
LSERTQEPVAVVASATANSPTDLLVRVDDMSEEEVAALLENLNKVS